MSELDRAIRTDIELQVVARDREIHLLFNETDAEGTKKAAYTPNFLLSASDALSLSSLLADLAFEAETSLKVPEAMKKELVARHRKTLLNRIRVMLNSTREVRTINNHALAQTIVDAVSKEVFD